MHKRAVFAILAILALLTQTLPASAREPEIPWRMQPDSILVYDEACRPQVLRGGYLPGWAGNPVRLFDLEPLPEDAGPAEAAALRGWNQRAVLESLDLLLGFRPGDAYVREVLLCRNAEGELVAMHYVCSPSTGVCPGLRATYAPDGCLCGLSYPDGAPAETLYELPSAALPLTAALQPLGTWLLLHTT